MPVAAPVAAAIIGGGAALGAGALGFAGAKSAQKSQEKSSSEAIALAREQEAERRREWDKQQAAAAYQWKVMQANLAPYRAARASVLGKYGINTNVEEPPMPPDFMGGALDMPGLAAPPFKAGGGGGAGALAALGMGLGGGSAALQAYLANRSPQTFRAYDPSMGGGAGGFSAGPGLTGQGPGYAMSPMTGYGGPEMAGPPASQIQVGPQNLTNWEDWNNYIGGD